MDAYINYFQDNSTLLIIIMFIIVSIILSCMSTITPSQIDTNFGKYTDINGVVKIISKLPIELSCVSLEAEYSPPCTENVPVTCHGMFLVNGNVIHPDGTKTDITNVVTDAISFAEVDKVIYQIKLDHATPEQVKEKVDGLN